MLFLQDLTFWTIMLMVLLGADTSASDLREYCQEDQFTASCADLDAVVLMTEARFGRMRLGKCVRDNLGYLPCERDVLRLMDSRCSGHQSCQLSVMDPALRSVKPCSGEVTWHLEAAYKCIKLASGDSMHECATHRHATVDESSGFLGSALSMRGSQGSHSCPYRLRGEPGQRINITLFNFLSPQLTSDITLPDNCQGMVVVRDGGAHGQKKTFSMCSRDQRAAIRYVSESHLVDVYFEERSSESGVQALVQYQVIGCGSLKLPHGSYAKRKGTRMTVHCNKTDQQWTVHCKDDKWVGIVGNCSNPHSEATDWSVDDLFGDEDSFPYGILIVVAVGVALGIFLGGSLLFLASIYIKRKRQRYLSSNIPDCVLTSGHDPHTVRQADDALCLEGKTYADSDYDPCDFRVMPPHHLVHQATTRDAVLVQKSGKTEVTCSPGNKGTLGHNTHVQYGSNARPCQHHYESPAFS